MSLKHKFPELTFIGKKFIIFLSGLCQQGWCLNLPISFSALQKNRQLQWEWNSCPPTSYPGSLGKRCEFLPYAIPYSGYTEILDPDACLQMPALLPISFVVLGKMLYLSVPLFSYK